MTSKREISVHTLKREILVKLKILVELVKERWKSCLNWLKERWKSSLIWLGIFALLSIVVWRLIYAPIYGDTRLMVSRVLIVTALGGSIAFLTTWRVSGEKLQRALREDYGERCCNPAPKEVPEDHKSADKTV